MAFGHRAPKYRPQRATLLAPCLIASPNLGRAAQRRRSCGSRRRRAPWRCGLSARMASGVTAAGHERIVTGFDAAERTADALARR